MPKNRGGNALVDKRKMECSWLARVSPICSKLAATTTAGPLRYGQQTQQAQSPLASAAGGPSDLLCMPTRVKGEKARRPEARAPWREIRLPAWLPSATNP